jgi:hypothetical protein
VFFPEKGGLIAILALLKDTKLKNNVNLKKYAT